MGQFCSGGSGPDLDVNTDKINEMINGSLVATEYKTKENVEIFAAGIADAGDDPYKVPDSEVELTKESTKAEIGKAAVAAAFAAVKKDELKANIWKEVESHLDKQIEAMEEEKRPAAEEITGSKEDIKARDVDEAVESAFKDKQAELEKFYDPEPEPEPEAEEAAEEKKDDEKEEEPKEEAGDDDAAKEDDKAAEEEPAADEAATEEPAKEEAAEEPAAEEAAAEEPAAEDDNK